jgi:predicted acetyltransferase
VDYPIRPITPDEAQKFFASNAIAFGHDPRPIEGIESTLKYADLTRSISVWDQEQVVSTAGTWTFEMTVPGGSVPCGGLTWVGVLPSHRRKGILTAMMRYQLDQCRDRGEAIAALWASESVIYSRFGYGMAAEGVEFTIDRTRTALHHAPGFSGRTRYIERPEAMDKFPQIWDAVRPVFPGMHNRTPGWWEHRVLRDPPWPAPPGYSSLINVLYEEDGKPLGYLRYRVKEDYHQGNANSTLLVNSLFGVTDAAYSALWQHVFGVDLIGTITGDWRPIDEPLYHMLADPRRLTRRPSDTLWVRILDTPRALAARKYATSGELIIELKDEFCPWNAGRYVLQGGPNGSQCYASSVKPAELTMTVNELGALYLGGMRAHQLARAGRIEGSAEAIARADAMFAWNPLPWAPEVW